LDNGLYEALGLFLGLILASMNFVGQNNMYMTLAPILAVSRGKLGKNLQRNMAILFNALRVCYIIVGCVLAGFARTKHHNLVLMGILVCTTVLAWISLSVQGWFAGLLKSIVEQTMQATQMASATGVARVELEMVIRKLSKFQRGILITNVVQTVINGIVIGLFLGFQQHLPYAWVLWPFQFLSSYSYLFTCYGFMRKEQATSTSSDLKTGPDNTRALAANTMNGSYEGHNPRIDSIRIQPRVDSVGHSSTAQD
jgi:hypothetical protein